MKQLIDFLKTIAHSYTACILGALFSTVMWYLVITYGKALIHGTMQLLTNPALINTYGTGSIIIGYGIMVIATFGAAYLSYHLSKFVILTSMNKLYTED